jgi:hypothetical protein
MFEFYIYEFVFFVFVIFVFTLGFLFFYLMPIYIALKRDCKNKLLISITNILLGITLVGWGFAFYWSLTEEVK